MSSSIDLPYDIIEYIGGFISNDCDLISLFMGNKLLHSRFKKKYNKRVICEHESNHYCSIFPPYGFHGTTGVVKFTPLVTRRINEGIEFTFTDSDYSFNLYKGKMYICYHLPCGGFKVTIRCRKLAGYHNKLCSKHTN
jgi:hypothetical protein